MSFRSVNASNGAPSTARTEIKTDGATPDDILSGLMSEVSGGGKSSSGADDADGDVEVVANESDEASSDGESSGEEAGDEIANIPEELKAKDEAPTNELEVKSDGKTYKFNLSPDDKNLKRTLEWGMAAPRLAKERKEALRNVAAKDQEIAQMRESSRIASEIEELKSAGNMTLAVKAALGDDNFKKWFNDTVFKRVKYELAKVDDPETASKIAQEFLDADKADRDYLTNREIKRRDERIAALESGEAARNQRSIAEAEFARYDFADVGDEAKASVFKDKLWKLAMADIEEYVEDVKERTGKYPTLTREQYRKAFTENYKIMTNANKTASVAKAKKADVKQEAEKNKATKVAKKALPRKAEATKDFDNMGVFDRLSALKNLI